MVQNVAKIPTPTLIVSAGADREIYPQTHTAPVLEALAAEDRTHEHFETARHYFEPPFGQTAAPDVDKLTGVIIDWIRARFST